MSKTTTEIVSEVAPVASRRAADLPMPLASAADEAGRVVGLSDQQELALEWLVGGGSVGEAAQFAGVSRQTISRWLRADPDFRAVYDAWKLEVSDVLEGRLLAAGEAAMDNLLNAVRIGRNVKASEFVVKTLLARAKARRE